MEDMDCPYADGEQILESFSIPRDEDREYYSMCINVVIFVVARLLAWFMMYRKVSKSEGGVWCEGFFIFITSSPPVV